LDVEKDAINDEKLTEKTGKLFVDHLYKSRKGMFAKIRKSVYTKSRRKDKYGSPVSIIVNVVSPKKVDIEEDPFLFEDEVWVEDRFGRRFPILGYSSSLRIAKKRETKDAIVRVYAIFDGIKKPESDVLDFVESICLDEILSVWTKWKRKENL